VASEIQTLLDGTEALVTTNGTDIEVLALDVIASYSELLGEPDPVQTVALIRKAMATKDHSGLWGPLYEHLAAGLGELVDAGVPPEFMPDLLEEATGSPVPGREKVHGLRSAQAAAKGRLGTATVTGKDAAELRALLKGREGRLKGGRAAFLKSVAPPRKEPVSTAAPLFSDE